LRWSIQDDGDGLRLNVALLFAGSDVVAWSHTYLCRPRDFRELPSYAADQIVQCLWLKVFSSPTGPVVHHYEKPGSREAYLKGRYFWNQRSEQGLRKAIGCFESAIQEDPEFALPYSGLADSLTLLSFYEIVSPSEVMPSARRALVRSTSTSMEPDATTKSPSFLASKKSSGSKLGLTTRRSFSPGATSPAAW